MGEEAVLSLEQALVKTEADIDAALKAATGVVAALKKVRKAAQLGNLRDLQTTVNNAGQEIARLSDRFDQARTGWDFDEETYFSTNNFFDELRRTAAANDLKIFSQDDRLFCYPVLIRALPGDRAVMIDKKRERRLRPTVLTRHLKGLQQKPPRFRPEPFLESIYQAYRAACALRGKKMSDHGAGPSIRLRDIYQQLTMLPGQTRDYSIQEFARDIYLLDQSSIATTKKGNVISFDASTGTKASSSTLNIITKTGEEKRYYAVSFM